MAYDLQEHNLREYNGYEIKRKDPFGFWSIRAIKGRTPNILDGTYTSPAKAIKEIDVYLKNKKE